MDSHRIAKIFFADMNEGWIIEKKQLRRKCEELLESNVYKPEVWMECDRIFD